MGKDDIVSKLSAESGLTSRREALRSLGSAAIAGCAFVGTGHAESAHPDAALLRLGAEFDQLHAAWLPLNEEVFRLHAVVMKDYSIEALCDNNLELWNRRGKECSLDEAHAEESKACEFLDAVAKTIRSTSAKTFAGIAVKARVLRYETGHSWKQYIEPEDPGYDVEMMNEFVAELDQLAAAHEPSL